MDSEQKSHQDFSRSPAGSGLPGVPALNVVSKPLLITRVISSVASGQEGRPP